MLHTFFYSFFRNLRSNKNYSQLNVLGLAIAIACSGLIFLWVEDEYNFDSTQKNRDRLFAVKVVKEFSGNVYTMGSTPRVMAAALKEELPGVEAVARMSDEPQKILLHNGSDALYASGVYADAALFTMLSFEFVDGNPKQPFPQLHSIVLTESLAQKTFGKNIRATGKTIRIDNKQDFVISGVVKDFPSNSSFRAEWYAPYISKEDSWSSFGPNTFVQLSDRANLSKLNSQMKTFIQEKNPDEKAESFLFPMSQWRLYGEFENGKATGSGRIRQVNMMLLIAGIILLIGCINFMNLATASSQQRAREIGVRKVLGAGQRKLALRFLAESCLTAFIACSIAVCFILISLPAFADLMQKELHADLLKPSHFISLLAIPLVCGMVGGVYPAVYLSSFNPVSVLKGFNIKTYAAGIIRKGLVVFQFATSVVFIICTIIVYQQIQFVKHRSLGLQKDNLVELDLQHDVTSIFPTIREELLQTGSIQNAAIADHPVINGGNTDDRFRWMGKAEDDKTSIAFRYIGDGFIATTGMKIIDGRDFTASDANNVIISQSLAKQMGGGSAVGKIIQSPRGHEDGSYTNLTVVGVVQDFVYGNVFGKPGPVLFLTAGSNNQQLIYAKIKPGKTEAALSQIEKVLKKNNPAYPLQYRFVDEQFEKKFDTEMQTGKVAGIFAVLAIAISCLGLFALAAFTAERRIREVGIRKVLGASITGLVALLSRGFLFLVLLASLVAFPIAWWLMSDWLNGYENRISVSPWIFVAAFLLAAVIAMLTISFHALRSALMNPAQSLKVE